MTAQAGSLTINAQAGKANAIAAALVNSTFTVRDTGDAVVPGVGCTQLDANAVTCSAAGITRITVNSGDLSDVVTVPLTLPVTVLAGDGSDRVTTGTGTDTSTGTSATT